MTEGQGRALPNERMRWLILAIQDQMGTHGLRLVLRQADLHHYIERLPPSNFQPAIRSPEYARLIDAVRTYFGIGSRGTLMRIGRAIFRQELNQRPLFTLGRRLLLLPLPHDSKRLWILNRLAGAMSAPGNGVTVHQADQNLWLVDRTFDRTFGVSSETQICWTAVGEISEALFWATGREHQVDEVSCRATGAESCRFEIR